MEEVSRENIEKHIEVMEKTARIQLEKQINDYQTVINPCPICNHYKNKIYDEVCPSCSYFYASNFELKH